MKCIKSLIMIISLMTITYATPQEKAQYKAIIFDMDGTILNTEVIWEQANYHVLTTFSPGLTGEEKNAIVKSLKGLTLQENWKLLQDNCSIPVSTEELVREKTAYVHDVYENKGVSFIHFFHEFHTLAAQYNLKTAIATNASQASINTLLQSTPLDTYFAEHIYNVDHVNKEFKPKPDIYLYAAQMLNIDPKDCIAIEDSAMGIRAAKAAGMYCIGINTGKNRNLLKEADEIIECFSEINLEKLLYKK